MEKKAESSTIFIDESKLTEEQKAELKEIAMSTFAEAHHRLPDPEELIRYQNVMMTELKTLLSEKAARTKRGFEILAEFLPNSVPPVVWNQIKEEVKEASKISDDGDKNYQELLGFSDNTMGLVFDFGVDLLKKDKNEDAVAVFDCLTTLNPDRPGYWVGYGMALKNLGKLENALYCFGLTFEMDAEPIIARLQSIDCNLSLNRKNEAKHEFDELEKLLKEKPELAKGYEGFIQSFREKLIN